VDRLRQALEAVADEHQDVGDTAVLDLGEHVHPVLGAFPAAACPDPQDVPLPIDGDADGYVERLVGDLSVADFHHDRVDEHHRIDRAVSSDRCES